MAEAFSGIRERVLAWKAASVKISAPRGTEGRDLLSGLERRGGWLDAVRDWEREGEGEKVG